jgi:hypothetical protein
MNRAEIWIFGSVSTGAYTAPPMRREKAIVRPWKLTLIASEKTTGTAAIVNCSSQSTLNKDGGLKVNQLLGKLRECAFCNGTRVFLRYFRVT